MSTVGKTINCKAAVAWGPKQPLDITQIEVAPPKAGEVRIKVISNALCHTDVYTLDGLDPEGLFPCVLGHEATAIVESVGEGVTSVQPGDVVIPCYTPQCGSPDCIFCQSPKTNLCPTIRATQGKGVMPDGTTRLSKDGKPIYHFMGCSTFAEYAVIAEISAAKVNKNADLDQICLLGCGVATGWGAVTNNVKMEAGSSVAVFGLGALGLAVIQAAKEVGARYIVGIDTNSSKAEVAKKFGCHEFLNPTELSGDIKSHLLQKEKWGYDYTFDCTGNTQVMRDALEVAHRGWGQSCVIGVAASGKEISTRPFQLITGREWKGTAFGGWKSRTEVPQLVQKVMRKEAPLEPYITHVFKGLENVNNAIEALHDGNCLRAVVHIGDHDNKPLQGINLKSNVKCYGGELKQISHWSDVCQCEMTFSVFVPTPKARNTPPAPVLYYLSGLVCTDENARTKSTFQRYAAEHGIVVVFPDTSPRGSHVPTVQDTWSFGVGAGFYVNATQDPWKNNYQMFDYVNKELPELIQTLFYVDPERTSIMGHSMGGHGALVSHLRNPGKFKSVSAFAPICNPTEVPWGKRAFEGYLGSVEAGKQYDAVELIQSYTGPKVPLLIDQGMNDQFLKEQLHPQKLRDACLKHNYPLQLRMHPGYDHSYFFISSFIEDHIVHHARALSS